MSPLITDINSFVSSVIMAGQRGITVETRISEVLNEHIMVVVQLAVNTQLISFDLVFLETPMLWNFNDAGVFQFRVRVWILLLAGNP